MSSKPKYLRRCRRPWLTAKYVGFPGVLTAKGSLIFDLSGCFISFSLYSLKIHLMFHYAHGQHGEEEHKAAGWVIQFSWSLFGVHQCTDLLGILKWEKRKQFTESGQIYFCYRFQVCFCFILLKHFSNNQEKLPKNKSLNVHPCSQQIFVSKCYTYSQIRV